MVGHRNLATGRLVVAHLLLPAPLLIGDQPASERQADWSQLVAVVASSAWPSGIRVAALIAQLAVQNRRELR